MRFSRKQSEKSIFISKILMIVLLCTGCIVAVMLGLTIKPSKKDDIIINSETIKIFTLTELDQTTEQHEPTVIYLSESPSDVINHAGEYILSGKTDAPIVIDTADENVHLFLNNVEVRTSNGPAIFVRSAGKVIITLVDGSTNILQDAASYKGYEDYDAALDCPVDLTINGDGTLYVYGYYEDAIHSKDIVKLLGGQIYIQAKRDGIRGNDGVLITSDKLSVESEQYAIRTTKSGKNNKGTIDVSGGDISIIAGQYGFVTDSDLYIRGCKLYCKSVISDADVGGNQYIEEDCFVNE